MSPEVKVELIGFNFVCFVSLITYNYLSFWIDEKINEENEFEAIKIHIIFLSFPSL